MASDDELELALCCHRLGDGVSGAAAAPGSAAIAGRTHLIPYPVSRTSGVPYPVSRIPYPVSRIRIRECRVRISKEVSYYTPDGLP